MRTINQLVTGATENTYFRTLLGASGSGTLDKGNLSAAEEAYAFSAHYHIDNAVNLPGPGAIAVGLAMSPFNLGSLMAPDLPPQRTRPYVCLSGTMEEDIQMKLPEDFRINALPRSQTVQAGDISLTASYDEKGSLLHEDLRIRAAHPGATCNAGDYAALRPELVAMLSALRAQIVYQ
jgi:hypothetical protein